MDLTPLQIRQVIVGLFVLVISVALHEFGHAVVAYKLGDDTPKRQGRVTLNPLAHADPLGTFVVPVMGAIVMAASGGAGGGFGWGKPVEWNPARVRKSISMSTANILVSIAGPGMNFVLGVVIAAVNALLLAKGVVHAGSEVDFHLHVACITNFVLMIFNLVPLPPLDGGHVVQAMMPYKHRKSYENVARYGPFIILAIIAISPLRKVFQVPALWIADHVWMLLGMR